MTKTKNKEIIVIEESSASSANVDTSSEDAKPKTDSNTAEQTVKYESFEKLLNQHKGSKAENAALKEEVAAIKAAEQERKERELAEQGEWKKIVELKEAEAEKLRREVEAERTKTRSATEVLDNAQKLQAVCDKLPGRVKNNRYLSYIDIEQVALNPETGEIDEASVQTVANSFMEEYGKDLVDTSHIGRLPADHASKTKALHTTYRDLPLKDMRNNITAAVRAAKQEIGV